MSHSPTGRFVPSSAGVPATTFFYRNGPQLAALFDYVFPMVRQGDVIRVRCWECSIGAEPYSLAIEYDRRKITDYRLDIEALDRDRELIQGAIQGEFNEVEIFYNGFGQMPRDILYVYFDQDDAGNYTLREDIRAMVLFGTADLLSEQHARMPQVDVLLSQNTLMHLKPAEVRLAMKNLVAQTHPGGVIALGGTNPDLLAEGVREYDLEPLTYHLEEIHEGWRFRRSRPDAHWGLRPINTSREDWQIRYCSLFRTPGS